MPAPLDVGVSTGHDDSPNGDAKIEVAGKIEIADRAGIEPSARWLQLVDICIARTLGAPETVPAGKHETNASNRSRSLASRPSTTDVRCITWKSARDP